MTQNCAIAIGINQYKYLQPLGIAQRDAETMRDFLVNEAGFDRVLFFPNRFPAIWIADGSTLEERRRQFQALCERPQTVLVGKVMKQLPKGGLLICHGINMLLFQTAQIYQQTYVQAGIVKTSRILPQYSSYCLNFIKNQRFILWIYGCYRLCIHTAFSFLQSYSLVTHLFKKIFRVIPVDVPLGEQLACV